MADLTFWKKDGKVIIDKDRKPIKCDHCPCTFSVPSSITIYVYYWDLTYDDMGYNVVSCSRGELDTTYNFTLVEDSERNDNNGNTVASYEHVSELIGGPPDEDPTCHTLIYLTFNSDTQCIDISASYTEDECGLHHGYWSFPVIHEDTICPPMPDPYRWCEVNV